MLLSCEFVDIVKSIPIFCEYWYVTSFIFDIWQVQLSHVQLCNTACYSIFKTYSRDNIHHRATYEIWTLCALFGKKEIKKNLLWISSCLRSRVVHTVFSLQQFHCMSLRIGRTSSTKTAPGTQWTWCCCQEVSLCMLDSVCWPLSFMCLLVWDVATGNGN